MDQFRNVVYSRESTRKAFIVRFDIRFEYFGTHYSQIYEPIYVSRDNYWDATKFPLHMEDSVRKLLDTNESWKKYGRYTIIYLSYKEREEIVFDESH